MSPAAAGVIVLCALALAAQAEPIYLETQHPAAAPEQAAQKSGKAVPLTDTVSTRAYEVTGCKWSFTCGTARGPIHTARSLRCLLLRLPAGQLALRQS